MKRISAVVRQERLDELRQALGVLDVWGVTATTVQDYSPQRHPTVTWRGANTPLPCSTKVEIAVTVHDDDVDQVVKTIICRARTGQPGDGFVTVSPVDHQYSIRTGERGVS
jgi:nitrogen regulatory protein P-II 1